MSELLIDTNVISEVTKKLPAPEVVDWFSAQNPEGMFLSVVTLAELARGIDRLPASRRRTGLEEWFESLLVDFDGRILEVSSAIAIRWGRLVATLEQAGRGYSVFDTLLAASAIENNLAIVTRNARDFDATGARILNPWQ